MIDPVNMTLRDWSDSVILTVGDAWGFPRLDDESLWQDWASSFSRAYASQALPNPYQFDDWREWAMRVYPMLEVAL